MDKKITALTEIIKTSNNIVFFGGAGISTASGIPDFRSSNGLYSQKLNRNFSPEEAVSHSFFVRYPEEFFDFYKKNLVYPKATPNACHRALAKLEKMGKLKAVVTQNIDGLHQAAGSEKFTNCTEVCTEIIVRSVMPFMMQRMFCKNRELCFAKNAAVWSSRTLCCTRKGLTKKS